MRHKEGKKEGGGERETEDSKCWRRRKVDRERDTGERVGKGEVRKKLRKEGACPKQETSVPIAE